MLIIAHRGASGYEVENTLAAIKKALACKADMIEIDVRISQDGQLLVLHDPRLDRTTNGRGHVKKLPFERIKTFFANNGKPIPTLKEALNLINKKAKVNIDLKDYDAATPTVALIEEYVNKHKWQYDDFLISAFKLSILKKVKLLNKNIPIAINFSFLPWLFLLVTKLLNTRYLKPHKRLITQKFIQKAHKANLKIYAWTVNEEKDILKMKTLK